MKELHQLFPLKSYSLPGNVAIELMEENQVFIKISQASKAHMWFLVALYYRVGMTTWRPPVSGEAQEHLCFL